MKTSIASALSLFLAANAAAGTTISSPLPPGTMPTRSVSFEATSGPVTVRSGPAIELPNAADYLVRIGDLDRNGDGRLGRDEVPSRHALASEFRLVDRNHDGQVSAGELQAWR